jgi:hypothetical protein
VRPPKETRSSSFPTAPDAALLDTWNSRSGNWFYISIFLSEAVSMLFMFHKLHLAHHYAVQLLKIINNLAGWVPQFGF